MNELVFKIEQAILDLTLKAANLHKPDIPFAKGKDARPGWWVLAVGDELRSDSLSLRDKAREQLRLEVTRLGLEIKEHIWIWDHTNRAQLVVRTFKDLESAQAYAAALEARGIHVRVAREWPQDETP